MILFYRRFEELCSEFTTEEEINFTVALSAGM